MSEQEIEQRIKDEYRKHKNLDWSKIAAKKICIQIEESKQKEKKEYRLMDWNGDFMMNIL